MVGEKRWMNKFNFFISFDKILVFFLWDRNFKIKFYIILLVVIVFEGLVYIFLDLVLVVDKNDLFGKKIKVKIVYDFK